MTTAQDSPLAPPGVAAGTGDGSALWWSVGNHPPRGWFAPLLGLNVAALGVQSSAILRFGTGGLSTTYLTGTLTTLVLVTVTLRQRRHAAS